MQTKVIKIQTIGVGETEETLEYLTVYVPTFIDKDTMKELSPKIGSNGKLFKNVTLVDTHDDKPYYIVGNYIKEKQRIFKNKPIGYAK
jgi:hypothetical protein